MILASGELNSAALCFCFARKVCAGIADQLYIASSNVNSHTIRTAIYVQLCQVSRPTRVHEVDMPIKQLSDNSVYFDKMGWGDLPQVQLGAFQATLL